MTTQEWRDADFRLINERMQNSTASRCWACLSYVDSEEDHHFRSKRGPEGFDFPSMLTSGVRLSKEYAPI
ncbi:hypothetical protein OH492_16715 [Vibrio chagasii]|nr:hypothetical protein [Vibrio chagasii]